jgi:pimeloyl-ACP methyl ester carboxylesterase
LYDLTHRTIETHGVRLHAVEAGPRDGPLVLLLHGFPEFWYGWRRQIEPLAAAGFRVLVPDQRGYDMSDKPRGARAYDLDTLAADAIGLLDALGRERGSIVGHDWGAAVAWWTAIRHPERVERLAILNGPHPVVMRRALRRDPRQMLRSWYIFFFQIPRLPEWYLALGRHAKLARALRGRARPDDLVAEDVALYREAWSRPGAMTAMVNWYRAVFRRPPRVPADVRVRPPVLLLWGARDRYLGRELAQPSIELCDRGELVFLDDATHWIQHDAPDEVNRRLIAFLSQGQERREI